MPLVLTTGAFSKDAEFEAFLRHTLDAVELQLRTARATGGSSKVTIGRSADAGDLDAPGRMSVEIVSRTSPVWNAVPLTAKQACALEIADVRIFDHELSAAEVAEMFGEPDEPFIVVRP